MIQQLLHLIGLCPDHMTHLNILDVPYQEFLNFLNSIKYKLK